MSETKELKILKEDINYYLVDPNQSMAALNNYHKNKRLDRYLELSKNDSITLNKKKYTKKEYLTGIEFKVLFGIQREAERLNTDIIMLSNLGQSITKRLQEHGDKMSATELNRWRLEWQKLNKEYDLLMEKLEKNTDAGRSKVLLYCFGISQKLFFDNYVELLDVADGLYFTIVNLYDTADDTRVKNVIAPLVNPEMPDPTEQVINDAQKKIKQMKGID